MKKISLIGSLTHAVMVIILLVSFIGTGCRPSQDEIIAREQMRLRAEGQEGAAKVIRMDGRFIAFNNGPVLDTKTNLMWAAKDNGYDTNWANAKSYCENYRGGGYTDWRMPTQDELAGLYEEGCFYSKHRPAACNQEYPVIGVATELIDITCFWVWVSETRGPDLAAYFGFMFRIFSKGAPGWSYQSDAYGKRDLPVCSRK
jgi:hypothetical protein